MSLIETLQKPVFGRLPRISNPYGIPMPVALWLFNEGSGPIVNDLSGNGKDGTITGADWVSGKFGHCLYFDGTNSDKVRVTTDIAGLTELTISLWWLSDDLVSMQAIATHFSSSFGNTQLIWRWDGSNIDLYIYGTGGTDSLLNVSTGIAQSNWYHLAFTWEGNGRQKLYVNGVLKADEASTGTAIVSDANPGIDWGFYVSAGGQLQGNLDVPAVFNRALTAQQIAYLYRNPFPWFKRDPIELWSAAMAGAPPAGTILPQITTAYMRVSA